MTPLGETLRRARLERGITFEDAERVTRIPRKYLEALEQENFGILPAPVYARGFLRSYAGYLGLNPTDLLPFFPVGHVEEPKLEPLPQVKQPRTWSPSGVVAVAAVGILILIVVALYTVGREGSSSPLVDRRTQTAGEQAPPVAVPPQGQESGGGSVGPALALPDLAGQSLDEAIAKVEETGASYVVVEVRQGDVPAGQIVDQTPAPGTPVQPGDLVTLIVSR
ncbi:MAG TPA: helix-turn-helix domain-containing protein [Dehalococcoidia bacterium]|nr:helix-turn-helix domain-containing protein [Dehalococcoidia bacterium]